jgi:serine phosphatase RsbU (regulator of sigma subunit)/signal transduction protein with GAF and PtsI domain
VLADGAQTKTYMHRLLPALFSLSVGLVGLGLLGYRLATSQEGLPWLAILAFTALSLLIQRSSFHFGTPVLHSLAGVIDISAVLALGPTAGSTVAALSGFAYLESSALRHRKLDRHHLVEIPFFNAGLKASMALIGGVLYWVIAGPLPLGQRGRPPAQSLDGPVILAVCVLSLSWFIMDHVGWGLLDYSEGGLKRLRVFIQDAIPQALLIELLPLPASLVVALVYAHLGWLAFTMVALSVIAVATLTQHWADTRNELVHRVAELSTIERVGRTIVQAQLDVDELCDLMYECTRQVADATIFHLGLFDGDDYTLKLWVREGKPAPQRTFQLTPGVGLVNWLRESKQPILVRDFTTDMDSLPARPAYISEDPPRSAIYVPLIAGETVIGTMSAQSFQPGAYGDSDVRVLSALANQAAVAIQKAQLLAQERKRVRQLETIAGVTSQVTAILELDELFEQVVHLIRKNFGYYHVAIFTADRERETVTFQASASAGGKQVSVDLEWGRGLIGWVATNAEAVLVNDVENDKRYLCVAALDETHSELAVPLLLEQELVGVLDVQSDEVHAFGPDDLFILGTLGGQVALAIQKARLYEAERQQAWLSTALLQVAEAASRLSDMGAVLTTIVRLIPLLAGVDRCGIFLLDHDTEAFVPAQAYGLSLELHSTFDRLLFKPGTMPALDLLRLDRNPLLLNIADDAMLFPPDMIRTFDIREVALLPLLAQGDLLGVMMVDYAGKARPFSEHLLNLLAGMANQAATVIHSAQLVQARQEEAYVSMALLQVADLVGRSTDLAETMAGIVRITPMLVGVNACGILLWHEEVDRFVPLYEYGLSEEKRLAFQQSSLARDDTPMRELLAGEAFVLLKPFQDGAFLSAMLDPDDESAPGTNFLLALPLIVRGEVVGAMLVDYTGLLQRLTQRFMSILTGVAGQAAIAIESDHFLREAAEQERMRQELDVAQRIQASFLPEACPYIPGWELCTIWRSARQVGGDFYDFIPLPSLDGQAAGSEGRMGLVVADVADKGVPAALFMALCRTLVRTMAIDGRAPAAAIGRANDLILADARSDLFVTVFYIILQPASGAVRYVNAGHIPPLLVRAADGSVEELRTNGIALGVLPGVEFEERTASLDPGDVLILYTDGVTEATDAEGQMFGRQRLKELVSQYRDRSVSELAQTIDDVVASFAGNVAQFDDFTLVIAKRSIP